MSNQGALVGIRLVMKGKLPVTYTADVTVARRNLDDLNKNGIRDLVDSLMEENVPKVSPGKAGPLRVTVEFLTGESAERLVKEEAWWPTHQCFKTREGKWQLEETPAKKISFIREERL